MTVNGGATDRIATESFGWHSESRHSRSCVRGTGTSAPGAEIVRNLLRRSAPRFEEVGRQRARTPDCVVVHPRDAKVARRVPGQDDHARRFDQLRANRRRWTYVGPWVPGPVDTKAPMREGALAESLSQALDDALSKLERRRPDKAKVVNLRFFAGMTIPDAGVARGLFTCNRRAPLDLVVRAKRHTGIRPRRMRFSAEFLGNQRWFFALYFIRNTALPFREESSTLHTE